MHQGMQFGVATAPRVIARTPPGLEHPSLESPTRVLRLPPGLPHPDTWERGGVFVSPEVPDSRTASKEAPSTRCLSKESLGSFAERLDSDDDDAYEPDLRSSTCASPGNLDCGVLLLSTMPATAPTLPPPVALPPHQVFAAGPAPSPPLPPQCGSWPPSARRQPAGEQLCRHDIPSVGSAGHHLGLCTPCDFASRGCRAGNSCEFCHLCGPGESQRRKKERKKILKSLPSWQRSPGEIRGPGEPVPIGRPVTL